MANCLVTKLKSAVDNIELDRLGELNYILNFPNANSNFLYKVTGSPTICSKDAPASANATIIAGVPFNTPQYAAKIQGFSTGNLEIRNTDVYNLDTIFISATSAVTVVKPIKLSVLSKSKCTEVNTTGVRMVKGDLSDLPTTITRFTVGYTNNMVSGDVEGLNRFTNLSRINVGSGTIYGSIDNLISTSFEVIILHCAQVTGNVTSLAKNLSITELDISDSIKLEGTRDAFAAEQVRLGRNSGSCIYTPISGNRKTINYGSSMTNPTETETAQGYQIV